MIEEGRLKVICDAVIICLYTIDGLLRLAGSNPTTENFSFNLGNLEWRNTYLYTVDSGYSELSRDRQNWFTITEVHYNRSKLKALKGHKMKFTITESSLNPDSL